MIGTLLILFVACNEPVDPVPPKSDGPAPAAAPTSPPQNTPPVANTLRPTAVRAPVLEEADRPVASEVQQAIDLLATDPIGARSLLDAWLKDHPDDLDARYWRAQGELKTMAWKEAEIDARLAVEGAPDWVNPKVTLAGALAIQRRCDEALPIIESIITLRPDHHIGYANRGSCRYRLGDVDGAIADATRACELGSERACETVTKLERRKVWKQNLAKRAAEETPPAAEPQTATPTAPTPSPVNDTP